VLTLKQITPVRLIKNKFLHQVQEAEKRGATIEELNMLLGTRRAKKGIFEGDLEEGELEIGQVSAAIRKIQPASEIVKELWDHYLQIKKSMCS
jgi:enoyl-[acyl-carrier protein] reductase II